MFSQSKEISNVLEFESKDSSIELSNMPGISKEISLCSVQSADYTLSSGKFTGTYTPQHSVYKNGVKVTVARIESQIEAIMLKKSLPQVTNESEGVSTALATQSNVLALKDILPSVAEINQSHAFKLLKDAKTLGGMWEDFSHKINIKNGVVSVTTNYSNYNYNIAATNKLFQVSTPPLKRQAYADMNLSEDIIVTLNEIMLNQYPLIKQEQPCKVLEQDRINTSSDAILTRTYSSNKKLTTQYMTDAVKTYETLSKYTREVMQVIEMASIAGELAPHAVSHSHTKIDDVFYNVSRQVQIVHCLTDNELSSHSPVGMRKNIGGYYSAEYNVITFLADDYENHFLPSFIHEAAHAAFNMLYQNQSNPFLEDEPFAFQKAEYQTFRLAASKLGISEDSLNKTESTNDVIHLLKDNRFLERLSLRTSKQDLQPELDALALTDDDLTVLSQFADLVHFYKAEEISQELIVRVPQLFAEKVSASTIRVYFHAIMDYWDKEISPKISTFIDADPEVGSDKAETEEQFIEMLMHSTQTSTGCFHQFKHTPASSSRTSKTEEKEEEVLTPTMPDTDNPGDTFERFRAGL
jgi:hypothetical protein